MSYPSPLLLMLPYSIERIVPSVFKKLEDIALYLSGAF
jgi:hypothetical protein